MSLFVFFFIGVALQLLRRNGCRLNGIFILFVDKFFYCFVSVSILRYIIIEISFWKYVLRNWIIFWTK